MDGCAPPAVGEARFPERVSAGSVRLKGQARGGGPGLQPVRQRENLLKALSVPLHLQLECLAPSHL